MISMKGLSKAEVLSALYNRAKKPSYNVVLKKSVLFQILQMDPSIPFPFDKKIFFSSKDMSVEDAQNFLNVYQDSDHPLKHHYVCTRHLGIDLSGDSFDPTHYDLANGEGAAKEAIDQLRVKLNKPEEGFYETMQSGWFSQYSQALSQEEEREELTEEEDTDTLSQDDEFGATLPRGWFAQYSKELSEEKEQKGQAKAADKPVKDERKDFGATLKKGWFSQYSKEEGSREEEKPSNEPAKVEEEKEANQASFGSSLGRGWFRAYSDATPERPSENTHSDSEDDDAVLIVVQKLDNLNLRNK